MLTRDFRFHPTFHSRFLPTPRALRVLLPPGYQDEPERRYPVLYLHDGQNLFDASTAYGGTEWRVSETMDELLRAGEVEPLIVVGIDNTGEKRIEEYTPTKDPGLAAGGRAARYARLVVDELKPFIDHEYRTLPDATNTGVGGSSLGGLVSLYLGIRYPRVFGKLAIMSPSLWWDRKSILHRIQRVAHRQPQRIYLDIGTNEGRHPAAITGHARELRDLLVSKGWVPNEDLCYVEAEGADHSERAWAERVGPMLRFLYGRSREAMSHRSNGDYEAAFSRNESAEMV